MRFQEIALFRSKNSITKYEARGDDDWAKILYDAILNSNPIEIEYDTASQGYTMRRTILFITFWYQFFDEDDNRNKYTPHQLLEIAASFKYETLAENSQAAYISGYCNYRQDLRTFKAHRIKGGRVFECKKNLHKLSVNDIWKILQKGYADIAICMYNELREQEKQSLFFLGNYANALVMQGDLDKAAEIFKSISPDKLMPLSSISWKKACLGDFDYFITNDIKKEEYEKIQTIMKNNGW